MAEPVITPLVLARPRRLLNLAAVSDYLNDLYRTLVLGLDRYAHAINTGVGQLGTWSPGISADGTAGTATYTHRRGNYTLRGPDVYIWGDVQISAWSGAPSGNLRMHGLPFTSVNATPESPIMAFMLGGVNLTAGYTSTMGVIQTNSANVRFRELGDNVAAQLIQASAVTAASLRIEVAGSYRIDPDLPV